MILTLDIGNTNIKCAIFDDEEMVQYWRLSTNRAATSDEYGMKLMDLFRFHQMTPEMIEGVMISSVVPQINFTIEHMCRSYLNIKPIFITPEIEKGITIRYEPAEALGSDRIANAVAAYTLYGGPVIYIDFGTATNFGVVSESGEFLGGAICPGLKLAADVLTERTAKLPRFELTRPETVIGRNTITNMQSGIVFGYVGQVQYLINRMKQEIGRPDAKVVATGGMALLIAEESGVIDHLDGLLTLKGLRILYEKNRP